MATHSSILAWRIPWTQEPGRLQSMGSQRVEHDWSNWACMRDRRWVTQIMLPSPVQICLTKIKSLNTIANCVCNELGGQIWSRSSFFPLFRIPVWFSQVFFFFLNRGAVKAHCGYLFGNSTCYLDIGMVHAYPMESPWAYLLSPVASEPIWPQTVCCSASRHCSPTPPLACPASPHSLKSTLFEAPLRSCLILCWWQMYCHVFLTYLWVRCTGPMFYTLST